MLNTSNFSLHGVFLDVFGLGALLTGVSGIGKSLLALGLIRQGHQLIADDSVDIFRLPNGTLEGRCPELLHDFLNIHNFGIINVRRAFGDKAIAVKQRLQLIIELVELPPKPNKSDDPLLGVQCDQLILQTQVTKITIPAMPTLNLINLVEAAVRNQQLKLAGYSASEDFINRQQQLLETAL